MERPRIGEVVGQAVQKLRSERGWSQEETSRHLRDTGLPWSRAQVAAVELHRREEINLGEAVLVAEAFGVPLAALVEGEGSVRLGNTERPASAIRAALAGASPTDLGLRGPYNLPGMSPELHGQGPFYVKDQERGSVIYAASEVEAARRLGVDVERIRQASRELWEGRIFDVEQARRLTAALPHSVPIDEAVRGSAEELRRELRDWIKSHNDGR